MSRSDVLLSNRSPVLMVLSIADYRFGGLVIAGFPLCRPTHSRMTHSIPKFALAAHVLAIWNVAMAHRSICLPDFLAVSHVRRYSSGTDKGGKQIGRVRQAD